MFKLAAVQIALETCFAWRTILTANPPDKNGFIPLYFQIQRVLMERIHSGELSEGDILASEGELARQSNDCSTGPTRTEGKRLRRRPKRSRNIREPAKDGKERHVSSGFYEDMKQRGLVPSSRLLEQTVIRAGDDLTEKLRVAYGDAVMRLRRLRLADGIPMALEESAIPLGLFPGLDRINFAERSLYQILRENYGVPAGWAEEIIKATPATREESELLTIPKSASVLSISRVIMTAEETPTEVTCSRYRGDRYRASIRVPATPIE